MDHFRDLLFSKAFQVIPGPRYNQVSQDLRESRNILFYEVILREDTSWEQLRDKVYPSLVRYLRFKSIPPESAPGIVASLFYRDQFYLLEGSEFIQTYLEMEGLGPDDLRLRVEDWLSRGDAPSEDRRRTEEKDEFRHDLPAVRK